MSGPARATAVLHGGQLYVDVLRRSSSAHGPGRGVRQRRVCDALVLRHRVGTTGCTDGCLCFLEKLFRGHGSVSPKKQISQSNTV